MCFLVRMSRPMFTVERELTYQFKSAFCIIFSYNFGCIQDLYMAQSFSAIIELAHIPDIERSYGDSRIIRDLNALAKTKLLL